MFSLESTPQLVIETQQQLQTLSIWSEKLIDFTMSFVPKVIGAILVYFIGQWIIKRITKTTALIFKKRNLDHSLRSFLNSTIRVILIIMLIVAIIGILGVETTSFAALLAGVGLAIGGAFNGSLGNIAGGIIILVTRPFKIGDLIEAEGSFGLVQEIGIIHTYVLSSTNKVSILPNGKLVTNKVTNYSRQGNLRVDITIPVAHGTDVEKARKIAVEVMENHPNVISNPAPDIKVLETNDNGQVLVIWPRMKIEAYNERDPRAMERAYYSLFFGVREKVKHAFNENGIQSPDPTVNIVKKN